MIQCGSLGDDNPAVIKYICKVHLLLIWIELSYAGKNWSTKTLDPGPLHVRLALWLCVEQIGIDSSVCLEEGSSECTQSSPCVRSSMSKTK